MKYANMREISNVMDWINAFGMILAWNMKGWMVINVIWN